ncbi:MAG: hypothetical protein WBG48_06900 [Pricia sp.]
MQIKKSNIFIAQTPFQNFMAGKIVEQLFLEDGSMNYLYSSVTLDNKGYFDEYHPIEKKESLKKITTTYSAKKKISKRLKSGHCELFIPHTSAILSNYFFYSFPKERYGVRLNFYYEGILYFYKYYEPYKTKTHTVRKIFSLLVGFGYRRNSEILPVEHPSVNAIYTIFPEHTLGPKQKMVEVSLLKEKYTGQNNCVLIVGGKPSALEDSEVILLYREMIEKILQFPEESTVYFKGHHADTSSNFEIANAGRIEFQEITQNSAIEEVIELYRPSTILSYPSSALINLKAMYGKKIDVFSYYIDTKKQILEKIWPIFEKLNVYINLY